MMADARLNYAAKDIDKNLNDVEEKKLKEYRVEIIEYIKSDLFR